MRLGAIGLVKKTLSCTWTAKPIPCQTCFIECLELSTSAVSVFMAAFTDDSIFPCNCSAAGTAIFFADTEILVCGKKFLFGFGHLRGRNDRTVPRRKLPGWRTPVTSPGCHCHNSSVKLFDSIPCAISAFFECLYHVAVSPFRSCFRRCYHRCFSFPKHKYTTSLFLLSTAGSYQIPYIEMFSEIHRICFCCFCDDIIVFVVILECF
jgi:hypothetical protein